MSAAEQPLIPVPDVRNVLETMASSITRPKNNVLFQQGDPPAGVYVIRKGSVRMTVNAGESEILMRTAQPGSVLGLPGVLSDKPYSLTACTATACELGFVKRDDLIGLIRQSPSLGLQVLQLLSEEVRAARNAMATTRQTKS